MLLLSIIIFFFAASLGFYLLTYILDNKNTPKGIALIHGPLASIALIILIIYALCYHPSPIVSIVCFVLAALVGMMLIYRDLTGKSVPKWMVIAHGLIAVTGFIFLIFFCDDEVTLCKDGVRNA